MTLSVEFTQRTENLEILENKNGHGKVMDHKNTVKKSWNFVTTHRILPILPPI